LFQTQPRLRLVARGPGLLNAGAKLVRVDENGKLIDALKLVSRQTGVVKAPAEVGVAVLVEVNDAGLELGKALHVRAGQGAVRAARARAGARSGGLGSGDLDLPEALNDLDEKRVREVRAGARDAQRRGRDLDVDVGGGKRGGTGTYVTALKAYFAVGCEMVRSTVSDALGAMRVNLSLSPAMNGFELKSDSRSIRWK